MPHSAAAAAISAAFIYALVTGRWTEGQDIREYGAAVGGLVVGGLIAAPFAGLIAKRVPRRVLMTAVGVLVVWRVETRREGREEVGAAGA